MKPYEIAEKDVQIDTQQKFGEGGFGAVFKGRWNGKLVAIKVLTQKQCQISPFFCNLFFYMNNSIKKKAYLKGLLGVCQHSCRQFF